MSMMQALSGGFDAGGTPITIVQGYPTPISGTTGDGSAGLTVNFDTPLTAGDICIAFTSLDDTSDSGGAPTPTFIDGSGNTFDSMAATGNTGTTAVRISDSTASGGEAGVTMNYGGPAVRMSCQILVVRNLQDAAATDTATNSGNDSDPVLSGLTSTGLAVGIMAYAAASDQYANGPDSPYIRVGTGAGGASVFQEVMFYIGTTSANLTISLNTGEDYAFAAASFDGV